MGPPEQYVHQGSTVTLTCVVPAPYFQGTRPPRVVDWFHSDRLVSIQVQLRHMERVIHTNLLHRGSKWRDCYLLGKKKNIYCMHVKSVLLHFSYLVLLYMLSFFYSRIFSRSPFLSVFLFLHFPFNLPPLLRSRVQMFPA